MKLFHSALFAAAALALSASAFAAGPAKAVAMTEAQMAKIVGGNLSMTNSLAGSHTAQAPQSGNSRAWVNVTSGNGINTCVNNCF
jgi:hypothetical protein